MKINGSVILIASWIFNVSVGCAQQAPPEKKPTEKSSVPHSQNLFARTPEMGAHPAQMRPEPRPPAKQMPSKPKPAKKHSKKDRN
jgi:hypothetical protein